MKLENYFKLETPEWVWWLGIVEGRADVSLTGKYQVRIFGYHTDDLEELPTKDLPYAMCLNSVTSAGTSGIMETPHLVPGSTVVGFFADGKEGQMPIILGSIAGKPAAGGGPGQEDAFNDPNKKYPRGMWGDKTPGYAGVDEPDISKLARDEDAEEHYSLIQKRAEREVDIRTASAPSLQGDGVLDDKEGKDYAGAMWEEPHARAHGPYKTFEKKEFEPKYWDALADLKSGGTGAPKDPGEYTSLYPYNQVRESESGFIEERDNTGEHFRYAWHSPMGNFVEHQFDGTKVEKIKGDDYEVVVKDKNVLIRGSCNVTIMGDCKMLVQGDKYEEVEGDYFLTVFGDKIEKINGSHAKVVNTDQNYSIGGMRSNRVSLDDSLEVIGNQVQKVAGNKSEVISGDVTEKFLTNHVNQVGKNRHTKITETDKKEVGKKILHGCGEEMELGSGKDMKLQTLEDQFFIVAKEQTVNIGDPVGALSGTEYPGRQNVNVYGMPAVAQQTDPATGEVTKEAKAAVPGKQYTLIKGADELNAIMDVSVGGDGTKGTQTTTVHEGHHTLQTGTGSTILSNVTINAIGEQPGNLQIAGTTHSAGDVSTSAGNAPTLAAHKHKQTGGTASDGDGPDNKDTSVPDA